MTVHGVEPSAHSRPSHHPHAANGANARNFSKEGCSSIYWEFVSKHCQDVWNGTNTGSSILCLDNLSSECIKHLIAKINAMPGRKHIRITAFESSLRIRTLMPSRAHETSASVGTILVEEYNINAPAGVDWQDHLTLTGTASQHHHQLALIKEPDWSICPDVRGPDGVPSFLIEVGFTETMAELQRDKNEWFLFPDVLTVILVKVCSKRTTMQDAVELEVWTRAPNGIAIRRDHWYHDASNVQQVPDLGFQGSDLFQSGEFPPHINGLTQIRITSIRLRKYILKILASLG